MKKWGISYTETVDGVCEIEATTAAEAMNKLRKFGGKAGKCVPFNRQKDFHTELPVEEI